MTTVTIVGEDTREVDGEIVGGRVLVTSVALTDALGWTLEPEGLCRGDVCVPVRDRATLLVGDRVDVAAAAGALGRASVVDADAGIVAVALDRERRVTALRRSWRPTSPSTTSTACRIGSRSGEGRSGSCTRSPPGEAVAMTCPGGRRCRTSCATRTSRSSRSRSTSLPTTCGPGPTASRCRS